MSAVEILDRYAWWASLNHGGLLVAPSKLAEHFPAELPALAPALEGRLRRDLVRLREGGEGVLTTFLDTVLEEVLDLNAARWIKGSEVDKSWTRTAVTREAIRPRRVWLGPHNAVLPVFVPERVDGTVRPGVGRGRRDVARVVEWLRKANQKVALLAGGRHLRLIHAGTDYDAFCEWDTDLWFQEGAPGPQVTALRALLGREAIAPEAEGRPSRLLAAIQATRQGQAELSTALGERVRLAVETLIRESSPALEAIDAVGPGHVEKRDIYIAATRIVMRCVVILFAEARQDELLPRNNPIYEQSYGLGSLRNQLDRLAGGRAAERLRYSHFAWPRLLSLFSLLHDGSAHEALPITRYGGGLLAPGTADASDPVLRALAAFEGEGNAPSDAAVHSILELLCNSPVKVRQGRVSRWIEAPVDFSDLSSEYLGILYEGLLDFELRRAPADDAMVFLNLGDEPVLPITRLDRMTNEELAALLDKLAKSAKKAEPAEEEAEADEEAEDAEGEVESEAEEAVPVVAAVETVGEEDGAHAIREKIQLWAERAVKAAKLVKYPKNDKDPRAREQFNQEVTAKAKALVRREVMPGSWFLVRWGGTRKGSGTFYTRPQLAGPTVRRALEPLAYVPVSQTTDEATGLVTVTEWAPRKPEEILALKVCDPAMGSGSFLISALRYLTEALYESLHFHGRIEDRPDGVIPRLADGMPADHPWNEPLPVPREHPDFEQRLKARLKRHVVDACLYGVDLDPLAVELAKTALWVETMDPKLPFGFVDHKLKCGNALVGCWFDRFQDYPIMAWEREGGDKGHDRFVHHYRELKDKKGRPFLGPDGQPKKAGDKWTAAIKERRDEVIKPELKRWLEEQFRQKLFTFEVLGKTADAIHDEALAVFEKMHALSMGDAEGRERVYREEIVESKAIQRLREAFDTWCALWFWPGDELEKAPGPMTLLEPDEAARAIVKRVTEENRFYHWELEFPDVFARPGSGFDAMVGNPPWETIQPSSLEFFSNHDPLYRTHSKQEALQQQSRLFAEQNSVERTWITYASRFKALLNWYYYAAHPFDKDSRTSSERAQNTDRLRSRWEAARAERQSFADADHPFHQQDSAKAYTYKMFLEQAHALSRAGGMLAMIVPSGIYSDNGTRSLRHLFLDRCNWLYVYAFQNAKYVFAAVRDRVKVAIVLVNKTSTTSAIHVRFRLGPGDSPTAQEVEHDLSRAGRTLLLDAASIVRFSPSIRSLIEFTSDRDLTVLRKLYAAGPLMADPHAEGWGIESSREFNMTDDSACFQTRPKLEAKGFHPTEYGFWRDADDRTALPLYEGRLFAGFDFAAKGWVSGTGLRATWRDVPWKNKQIEPQYFVELKDATAHPLYRTRPKVSFRNIARSTDMRSFIGTVLVRDPTPHVTSNWFPKRIGDTWSLCAIINSYSMDYLARMRLAGTHLDYYLVSEFPLPKREGSAVLSLPVLRLANCHQKYAPEWLSLIPPSSRILPWRRLWAVTPHERLRLRCILDAVVAHLYGLDLADFSWILRDCDHPVTQVCNKPFSRTLDPKGFWRVDKNSDPELRHPVLSLIAFRDLLSLGLDAFLAQNDGEGWMLPATLRLDDHELGHDARAKEPQPVAARLGDRFLPWQLEQGVEESWDECRRHAETIERILGVKKPLDAPPPAHDAQPISGATRPPEPVITTAGQALLFAPQPAQKNLFGEVEESGRRRKKKP
jgi:hypothetical protein